MRLSNSASMKFYLDNVIQRNSIRITRKIHDETAVKIWDILSEKGGRARLKPDTIYRLIQLSYANFTQLQHARIIENDNSLLEDVQQMYADIWNDPAKQNKKLTWASIKHLQVNQGPPSGPDLEILSTVAVMARTQNVRLLTFDHDFIVFKEEIFQTFNVEVENAGLIPDP